MSVNSYFPSEVPQFDPVDKARLRKIYHPPQLDELGDLRTLTLGASPSGFDDSGGGFLYDRASSSPPEEFPDPGGFSQP